MRPSKKPGSIKNNSTKMARLCPCEFIQKNPSTNKQYAKNEDVLCNPQNPVHPDSKPGVRGKFIL